MQNNTQSSNVLHVDANNAKLFLRHIRVMRSQGLHVVTVLSLRGKFRNRLEIINVTVLFWKRFKKPRCGNKKNHRACIRVIY